MILLFSFLIIAYKTIRISKEEDNPTKCYFFIFNVL